MHTIQKQQGDILMQEEIFRFTVVRNPQRPSAKKLQTSVIPLIDERINNFPIYKDFLDIKKNGGVRDEFISFAHRKLDDENFIKNLSQLKTNLNDLSEWIYSQKKYKSQEIVKKAKSLFGDNLSESIKKAPFKEDKYRVSDSLVTVSIVKPKQNGLRSELMKIRRLVFLLEYLAKAESVDPDDVHNILSATILLPSDLFPIPNKNNELRKNNEEELKKRKGKIEESIKRINVSSEKLKKNTEAIDELKKSYSKHLFQTKNTPSRDSVPSLSLAFLPAEKFNKLSDATKVIVLKDVGISEKMVDIPFVVEFIESENNKLAFNVNTDFGELGEIIFPDHSFEIVEATCGACKVISVEELKLENNFTGETKGKVNKIEGQDLMMVRQKLLKYEPGEIAHIENVLKGESKNKNHRKLHRVEETLFEETERIEESENENETTERFELQSETSKTISQDMSLEAGVKVTASYGTVNVEAHGNYASNNATEESRNSATTYAKDIVSRSIQKIQERALERRSRTDISEVEVINKHKIDNATNPSGNITGIYRWVNKFYEAQVVDYGTRVMLEFMVPEPSAFYRFALTKNPNKQINIQKPDEPGFCNAGRFSLLEPTDLSWSNYLCFVGKYGVSDVQPPPKQFMEVFSNEKAAVDESPGKPASIQYEGGEIIVPKGYKIQYLKYQIEVGLGHIQGTGTSDGRDEMFLSVLLGNSEILQKDMKDWTDGGTEVNYTGPYKFIKDGELFDDGLITDSIQVSISGFSTLAMSVNVGVRLHCERTHQFYTEWQLKTFNAIMNAYKALKLEYDEALQSQQVETDINIQGQNPFINREVEKTELKKHAISILTGQQYESFNAMWQDHREGFGYPEIDLQDAAEEGEFVQFFEQALEWRHVTYLFYDYFWGRKQNWIELMHRKDTDPLFEKFLKAGYARVWVPIRPGFESVIGHYIACGGEPWTEKDAPQCDVEGFEEGYEQYPMISMIEEMKEQLDNDFVEREGTISIAIGEKRVVGEGTDFSEDDVNREILINLESYRIAEWISPTEIMLREAYQGEADVVSIGVALGVKYVGEPWVVQVPTSLVFLQLESEL